MILVYFGPFGFGSSVNAIYVLDWMMVFAPAIWDQLYGVIRKYLSPTRRSSGKGISLLQVWSLGQTLNPQTLKRAT